MRLMKEAGVNLVSIGIFSWPSWNRSLEFLISVGWTA